MIETWKHPMVSLEDCEPALTYHGIMSAELQLMLMHILEEHTQRMGVSRLMQKRMLGLSVECLHNLYHHAEDRQNERLGNEQVFFSVGKKMECCYIATGNFVTKAVASFLEKRLNELKSMSGTDLHALFLQILKHPGRSTKGGGGLGLVEMMRKTDRNIDFNLRQHHADRYYFMLVLNLPEPK